MHSPNILTTLWVVGALIGVPSSFAQGLPTEVAGFSEGRVQPAGPFPADFGYPREITPAQTKQKSTIEAGINTAPQIASVRLSSSSGRAVHMGLVANDANGARDIASVYVIVQSTLSARDACFVHYHLETDRFQLANDAASEWVTPGIPAGSPQLQSNSQCTLDGSVGRTTSREGLRLDDQFGRYVQFGLHFKAAFAGPKKVYVYAIDRSRAEAQWQEYAGFVVSGPTAPEIVGQKSAQFLSIAPDNATVKAEFGVRSQQGITEIATVYLIVNSVLSSANACLLELDVPGKRLRLANAAGTDWLPWVSVAQAASPRNEKCQGSMQLVTNRLTPIQAVADISVTYFDTASSRIGIFANVIDFAGQSSGWNEIGQLTRTAESRARTAPLLRPVGAQSGGEAFPFYNMPAVRLSALGSKNEVAPRLAYVLLGKQLSVSDEALTESCLAEFDRLTGEFRLANDDRTAWLPMAAKLGSETVLENSNCSLHAKFGEGLVLPDQFLPEAQSLFVRFPVQLKWIMGQEPNRFFYGVVVSLPKIYLKAVDPDGLATAWESYNDISPSLRPTVKPRYLDVRWAPWSKQGDLHGFAVETARTFDASSRPLLAMNLHSEKAVARSCHIEIRRQQGRYEAHLMNDSGTAFLPVALGQPGTQEVANSQCAISNLAVNDVSIDKLRYQLQVRFLGSYAVPSAVHAREEGTAGYSYWMSKSLRLLPGEFPQLSAMTPAVIGDQKPANFLVWHGRGVERLKVLRFKAGVDATAANGCIQEYDLRTRLHSGCSLGFVNPNDGVPDQGLPENSTRIRYGLGVSRTATFRLWAEVEDVGGLTSGWKEIGLYPSLSEGVIRISARPYEEAWNFGEQHGLPEFQPARGETSLSIALTHAGGVAKLRNVYVLFNSTLSNSGGCLYWISLQENRVRLATPAGNNWLSGGQPMVTVPNGTRRSGAAPYDLAQMGSAARLSNGNCFTLAGTSITETSEIGRTLTLYSGFHPAMGGVKRVYVFADDEAGNNTGWTEVWKQNILGEQRAPYFNPSPRTPNFIAEGSTMQASYSIADDNGILDVRTVEFAVGKGPEDLQGCRGRLDIQRGTVALYNDASSALGAAIAWTSTTLPANRTCAFGSGGLRIQGNEPTYNIPYPGISVSFPLQLLGMPDDTYGIYVRATDEAGLTAGWTHFGTFAKRPLANPQFIFPWSVTGAVEMISSQTRGPNRSFFDVLSWSDPAGSAKAKNVYFLIRSVAGSTANACFVNFDIQANLIRLAADSGNAWLPDTPKPGQGLTLANSQCRLRSANFTPSITSPNFTVEILGSTLNGYKALEVFAENQNGANSGWQVYRFLDIRP